MDEPGEGRRVVTCDDDKLHIFCGVAIVKREEFGADAGGVRCG